MTDRALILSVRARITELGMRLVDAGEHDAAADLRKRADAWQRACDKRENDRLAALAKTARTETERLERLLLSFELPMHTAVEKNSREHWAVKHHARGDQRPTVEIACAAHFNSRSIRPVIPCRVHLVRIAPHELDPGDGLPASLSRVRDGVADFLGINDRHADLVRYTYDQEKRGAQYGVRISFFAEAPA